MLFAARTMLVVIRASPFTTSQRVLRPFLKRLSHKFRTSPTHMDPTLFAAGIGFKIVKNLFMSPVPMEHLRGRR